MGAGGGGTRYADKLTTVIKSELGAPGEGQVYHHLSFKLVAART